MANFPLQADSACATSTPISFSAAHAAYRTARVHFEHTAPIVDADTCAAIGRASDNALGVMIAAPSNSVADLATKLEIMLVEYEDSEWDADRVKAIAEDARRLASPRATWDALIARLAEVEAQEPVADDDIDEAGDLIEKIMAMPAPNADAVRWKLDYVLDTRDGSFSDSYAPSYLEQTIADYRRFLGEARP